MPSEPQVPGGPFAESDDRFVSWLQAVIRDCEDCREHLGFVLIENLDNVTVGL